MHISLTGAPRKANMHIYFFEWWLYTQICILIYLYPIKSNYMPPSSPPTPPTSPPYMMLASAQSNCVVLWMIAAVVVQTSMASRATEPAHSEAATFFCLALSYLASTMRCFRWIGFTREQLTIKNSSSNCTHYWMEWVVMVLLRCCNGYEMSKGRGDDAYWYCAMVFAVMGAGGFGCSCGADCWWLT